MRFPDTLETARLILRPPARSDAGAIFAGYATDPAVSRFLVWEPHRSLADTDAFLAGAAAAATAGTSQAYVLVTRSDRLLAGVFDLRKDGPTAVTFGYVLARPLWGRGLMTEVLSAAVAWAAEQPELTRIWAYCDVDNPASGRVMEKAGLVFEGILPRYAVHPNISPEKRDCRCYGRNFDRSVTS